MITPNWKTGAGYPGPDATAQDWAWEFLRRNPEYRADWQRYCDEVKLAVELRHLQNGEDAESQQAGSKPNAEQQEVTLEPGPCEALTPYEPEEEDFEDWVWVDGERWALRRLSGDLGERWGLLMLCDPAMTRIRTLLAALRVTALAWRGPATAEHAGLRPEGPHEIVLQLDLSVPHERMMDCIDRLLRADRQHAKRYFGIEATASRLRADVYKNYLRVLDADQAGSGTDEICAVLWPELPNEYPDHSARKRLDKQRKEARALMNQGYRRLPQLTRRDA